MAVCLIAPVTLSLLHSDGCLRGSTSTFAAPGPLDRYRGPAVWVEGHGCDSLGGGVASFAPSKIGSARPVLVLRRGFCTFAEKSRRARLLGAQALVVVDFADSAASSVEHTLVAGDGHGDIGVVPTILVGRAAAETLLAALEVAKGGGDGMDFVVELRWDLLRPIARLDLWLPLPSPSNGPQDRLHSGAAGAGAGVAERFLLDIASHVQAFGHQLRVEPRYRVLALEVADSQTLMSDCLYTSAQFCAGVRGGGSGGSGDRDGAEMLREAERRHCVRVVHAGAVGGTPSIWWAYIEAFHAACGSEENSFASDASGLGRGKVGAVLEASARPSLAACSRRAMAACGISESAIDVCVAEQGLRLLEDDREARAWGGNMQLAIRVNDWLYSGPPTAKSVLLAVCRGLEQPPDVCDQLLAPPSFSAGGGMPLWALIGLCLALATATASLRACILCMLRRRRRAQCKRCKRL